MKLEEILMKREEIPIYSHISSYTKSEEHGVIVPIPAFVFEYFETSGRNTNSYAKEALGEVMNEENLIEAFSWEIDRRISIEKRIYDAYKKIDDKENPFTSINRGVFNYNGEDFKEFFDGKFGDMNYVAHRTSEFLGKKGTPEKILKENIENLEWLKKHFADDISKRIMKDYFERGHEPRVTGNDAGLCHITIDGGQGTALCIDSSSAANEFNIKNSKIQEYYPKLHSKHIYYPHNIDFLWQAVVSREWAVRYINKLIKISYNEK